MIDQKVRVHHFSNLHEIIKENTLKFQKLASVWIMEKLIFAYFNNLTARLQRRWTLELSLDKLD